MIALIKLFSKIVSIKRKETIVLSLVIVISVAFLVSSVLFVNSALLVTLINSEYPHRDYCRCIELLKSSRD